MLSGLHSFDGDRLPGKYIPIPSAAEELTGPVAYSQATGNHQRCWLMPRLPCTCGPLPELFHQPAVTSLPILSSWPTFILLQSLVHAPASLPHCPLQPLSSNGAGHAPVLGTTTYVPLLLHCTSISTSAP